MQKHVVICDVCGTETEAGGPKRLGNVRIYSSFQANGPSLSAVSPTGAFAVSPTGLVYDLCPGCMTAIDCTASGLPTVIRLGLQKLGWAGITDPDDAMAEEPSEEDSNA